MKTLKLTTAMRTPLDTHYLLGTCQQKKGVV
jgi:hypothetical protein